MILALGCSPWPSTQWRNLFLLSWLIYYLWSIHDFRFQLRLVWLPVIIFMFKVRLIPCIQKWGATWKTTFSPSSPGKNTLNLWSRMQQVLPSLITPAPFYCESISLPVTSFKTQAKFRCTIKSRFCTTHSTTLHQKIKWDWTSVFIRD